MTLSLSAIEGLMMGDGLTVALYTPTVKSLRIMVDPSLSGARACPERSRRDCDGRQSDRHPVYPDGQTVGDHGRSLPERSRRANSFSDGLTVYILECADGSYYTGMTSDLPRRLSAHDAGVNPVAYTYSRRPVKLKWAQEFHSKDDALRLEGQIKGWIRAKKEALINDDYQKIHEIVKAERLERASTTLSARRRKKSPSR